VWRVPCSLRDVVVRYGRRPEIANSISILHLRTAARRNNKRMRSSNRAGLDVYGLYIDRTRRHFAFLFGYFLTCVCLYTHIHTHIYIYIFIYERKLKKRHERVERIKRREKRREMKDCLFLRSRSSCTVRGSLPHRRYFLYPYHIYIYMYILYRPVTAVVVSKTRNRRL